MHFEAKTVRRTVNKAFLKEPVERTAFNRFKDTLGLLLDNIDDARARDEHEEHFKNFLEPFFHELFAINTHRSSGKDDAGRDGKPVSRTSTARSNYYINTHARIDLAVHTGPKAADRVGLLLEVKRPSNQAEMITKTRINRKAMHEAVLYYLEQRIEHGNTDLKHVIITNMDEWFFFDAQEFERCFYKPSALRDTWKEWKADRKVSSNNDFMYGEIARFMDEQEATLTGIHLPLPAVRKFLKGEPGSDYEKKLIPLFKLLTPTHLLKEPFANDSNSLNRGFYNELLYILGLEEVKQKSARYIRRVDEERRQPGSIIENTIRILDAEDHLSTVSDPGVKYGSGREEQQFHVALELGITWMNRILFLKLLEAQLYRYHRQDPKFKFLNYRNIDGFDELNKLFFQVLARREKDRSSDLNEKFGHIPYLNSSLFDVNRLEHETTRISGLDDHTEIPVYGRSVLTGDRGRSLNVLDYLFRFLDAYDFSAEGTEEIRDERKSLINASVLGLIFEKINGYRDGSFYTPGFITEYMARETLQKAVTDAFNRRYGWDCSGFDELYNHIHREKLPFDEANAVINELKICDPAVGSGHFLVSCLNELIAIKSQLDILCDTDGKVLRQVDVTVENDELIVSWDGEGEGLFDYDVSHTWRGTRLESRRVTSAVQRVQQALFYEKRHLIENCLFGVDINFNSVKICRLRLWIELLKRAYYTPESDYLELEVLPNIDINIKQGNSLVSRFELDSDLGEVFKAEDGSGAGSDSGSKTKSGSGISSGTGSTSGGDVSKTGGHSLEAYKEAVRAYKHSGDRIEKQRLQELIDEIKDEYRATLQNNRSINKKLSRERGKLKMMQDAVEYADLFGDKKFSKKDIETQKKKVRQLEAQRDEEESGDFYRQAFEWRFEFPEVLNNDGRFTGFDVVIGNPPYGIKFDKKEKEYLKIKLGYNYAESAILFVILGDNLLMDGGKQSFIVPKSFTFSSNYEMLRDKVLESIYSIVDCGKAWEEVKLEMIIFVRVKKNRFESYGSLKADKKSNVIYKQCVIEKYLVKKFKFFLNGINEEELKIGLKVDSSGRYFNDIVRNERGAYIQNKIKRNGFYKVIGGAEISRYGIIGVKGFLEKDIPIEGKAIVKKNSILVQNIVAHIKNPNEHIKIIAAIPEDKEFLITDTINQLVVKDELPREVIWSILVSKLINWYTYRFIFGKAIRTMHFDNTVTTRIPLPLVISSEDIKELVRISQEIMRIKKHKDDNEIFKYENILNLIVYKIYDIDEKQVSIIENSQE